MERLIREVLAANLALPKHGLVTFTWGNASGIDRAKGMVVIKPSGVSYDGMKESHMVVLDLEGHVVCGGYKPSSDTATHMEIYRSFPAVGGIVHCHSQWATAWAQSGRDLPAYGTTHADYFEGPVPCTRALRPEEIDGNYELNTGKVIVETFVGRNITPGAVPSVLVAGHAPFCWGPNVDSAVQNAVVLEQCAMMAVQTEYLNREAKPITQELLERHYRRKHGEVAYYGQ
jgi:L-ribulose-5-phosphate 4-epimerase